VRRTFPIKHRTCAKKLRLPVSKRSGLVEASEERPQTVNDAECRTIDDVHYAQSFARLCARQGDLYPASWKELPDNHPMVEVLFAAQGFYEDALHYYQLSNDWRTHDTLINNSFELTNRRARIAYLLGHKLPVVHFRPVERISRVAADIKLTQYPYFIARPAVPSSEGDYTGTLLNVDAARVKRATKAELAATYSAQLKEALDAYLACTTIIRRAPLQDYPPVEILVADDEDTMRKMVEAMEATEPRFRALCPKRKRVADEDADGEDA